MRAVFFLLRRALWPEPGSLSRYALWISVAGVALGIAQLMLVLSVMSGFKDMLEKNYTRITSAMVVVPPRDWKETGETQEVLLKVPGIEAVTPFSFGQGMMLKDGVGGVTLEGISWPSSQEVVDWPSLWLEGPNWELQKSTANWIWVGSQLAEKLHIKVGDKVNLMIAEEKKKKVVPFLVTAITKFGVYTHDLRYARVSLETLNTLFNRTGFEPMYKTRLAEGAVVRTVAKAAEKELGDAVTVKPWYTVHQNVFLAVEHQKKMLFLVLEIVVALAAVNVVNLLLISAQNKRRDVAILRAMGMKFRQVMLFFIAKGTVIGTLGVFSGVALGVGVCQLVMAFQPEFLSEAIYNAKKLPLRIEVLDVAAVCAVALFLCLLFSVIPAWKAASTRPVEALRYE